MDDTKVIWHYCPICGDIMNPRIPCECRSGISIKIDPKWDITDDAHERIWEMCKEGKITYRQYREGWIKHCEPFFQEVILKDPRYNETKHQIIVEETEKYIQHQEELTRKWEAEHSQPSAPAKPVITCPYCKSTNTKKLSSLSRALSAGIFGLGSSKIGKQWHCNSCGSDF